MPPSESLLLMFVTIYGVGMVGKGAIKDMGALASDQ